MTKITQRIRERIAKRFETTANKLETLPKKNFDYARFITKYDMKKDIKECGTIACAAGWYPVWYGKKSGLFYGGFDGTSLETKDNNYEIENQLSFFHETRPELDSYLQYSIVDICFYGLPIIEHRDEKQIPKKIIKLFPDVNGDIDKMSKQTNKKVAERFRNMAMLIREGYMDMELAPKPKSW